MYHFTDVEAACCIIESRQLRFGKMYRMNDLIESNRIVFGRIVKDELSERELYAEEEMNRYQQVSFTQDHEREGVDYLGFDLHTMWGLYADKGYGVCLVFDKNRLRLQEKDCCNDVEYRNFIPEDYEFKNKTKAGIRSEIRRAENEDDDEYLDVSDALSFVIICKDETVEKGESMWDGTTCYILQHLKRKVPVLTYEYDLDWYTLYSDRTGDPIWAEQIGYY